MSCGCGKQLGDAKSSLQVVNGTDRENVCSVPCANAALEDAFALLEEIELQETGDAIFASDEELERVVIRGRGCPCIHVKYGEADGCLCRPTLYGEVLDHVGGCILNRDRPSEKSVVSVLQNGVQIFSSCLYHSTQPWLKMP